MDTLGRSLDGKGTVMSQKQLVELRTKRGECVTCGRKCFQKKLFKMIPITDHGRVLEGRCLNCKPLQETDCDVLPAVSRPATRADLQKFSKSVSQLGLTSGSASASASMRGNMAQGQQFYSMRTNLSAGPPPLSNRGQSTQGHRNPSSRSLSAATSQSSIGSAVSTESFMSRSAGGAAGHSHGVGRNLSGNGSFDEPTTPHQERQEQPPQSRYSGPPQGRRGPNPNARQPPPQARGRGVESVDSGLSMDSMNYHDHHGSSPSRGGVEHPRREQYSHQNSLSRSSSHVREDDYSRGSGERDRRPSGEMDEVVRHMTEHSSHGDRRSQASGEHATAEALHDYYRLSFRELNHSSQRSHGSNDDHGGGYDVHPSHQDVPTHGQLNRGGAVPMANTRYPSSNSGSFRHGVPRTSSTSSSAYHCRNSTRSLDSTGSFCDDDDHGPGPSRGRRASAGHGMESPRGFGSRPQPSPPPDLRDRMPINDSDYGAARTRGVRRTSSGSSERDFLSHSSHGDEEDRGRMHPQPHREDVMRHRKGEDQYEEIINSMRNLPGSTEVQLGGLQDLSNLELTPEDYQRLADIEAIDVMLSAMRSFPDHKELQVYGCRAIWNASATDMNQRGFVEAGALDVVLDDLDRFLDDAELQEQAMAFLANLGASQGNLGEIIEKNAVARVVEGMNKHSGNMQVQEKGISVITNLAAHNSSLTKRVMEDGGGGAVVISMVMNPNDPELQEKALHALRNLSANSDENRVQLAHIGGVDAVISAMQVHRDSAGVQESGAWTLANLAMNPDNKAVIGETGGIDVIIRSMWVHSDSASVQEWCCRALFTLSLDDHNGAMILDVGGISAVVNTMQAHVDSSSVQEMGCAVLCNLASDQERKMKIVDEEALDAIVLAMVLHGDHPKVQERACQVLLQLAIVENFKSMQASNIGELARQAADKFPDTCGEASRRLLHVLEGYIADYR